MSMLTTPGLLLRQWRTGDFEPFAALNADTETMEFMGGCLSREASDAWAAWARSGLGQRGWGVGAVESRVTGEFIGAIGLSVPSFQTAFTPCTEMLWRLARASWGKGYATEAAREGLRFAFEALALPEVVSFTATGNRRSRAVMERLGMRHDPAADFDHPRLPSGHPLRRHVLYRRREAWARGLGPFK